MLGDTIGKGEADRIHRKLNDEMQAGSPPNASGTNSLSVHTTIPRAWDQDPEGRDRVATMVTKMAVTYLQKLALRSGASPRGHFRVNSVTYIPDNHPVREADGAEDLRDARFVITVTRVGSPINPDDISPPVTHGHPTVRQNLIRRYLDEVEEEEGGGEEDEGTPPTEGGD